MRSARPSRREKFIPLTIGLSKVKIRTAYQDDMKGIVESRGRTAQGQTPKKTAERIEH
jgi:hypothetical protein